MCAYYLLYILVLIHVRHLLQCLGNQHRNLGNLFKLFYRRTLKRPPIFFKSTNVDRRGASLPKKRLQKRRHTIGGGGGGGGWKGRLDQITREVLKEQLQQEIAEEYAEEDGDNGGVDDLMMELSFQGSRPEDKEVTTTVSQHFPKPPTVPACIIYTLLYTSVGGSGHTDCHGA